MELISLDTKVLLLLSSDHGKFQVSYVCEHVHAVCAWL